MRRFSSFYRRFSSVPAPPPLSPPDFLPVLSRRGFVSCLTHPVDEFSSVFAQPRAVYAGFDPTAASLHMGNLIVIMALKHAELCGHRVICLIGGATALIGDPSGRKSERALLAEGEVRQHELGIEKIMRKLLKDPIIVNNRDWHEKFSMLQFLREVGGDVRLASMLGKESVKARLEDGRGLSFLEFSYQLFQAFDFFKLWRDHSCLLQLGGSDQYGNITAGLDLINRKRKGEEAPAFGLTMPLLTTSNGEKFGKSAGNAVWLDRSLTSPYEVFQFFKRTRDDQVENLLKLFTLKNQTEIEKLVKGDKRIAIEALADSVTEFLHGPDGLLEARQASQALFGRKPSEDGDWMAAVPSLTMTLESFIGSPLYILLHSLKAVDSKADGKRLIKSGGISLNGQRIGDAAYRMTAEDAQKNPVVIAVGKRGKFIIQIEK